VSRHSTIGLPECGVIAQLGQSVPHREGLCGAKDYDLASNKSAAEHTLNLVHLKLQVISTQAKAEAETDVDVKVEDLAAMPVEPSIAPPVIDFELARISEEADSHLPESLNFDLQMPDMSKVSCHS